MELFQTFKAMLEKLLFLPRCLGLFLPCKNPTILMQRRSCKMALRGQERGPSSASHYPSQSNRYISKSSWIHQMNNYQINTTKQPRSALKVTKLGNPAEFLTHNIIRLTKTIVLLSLQVLGLLHSNSYCSLHKILWSRKFR